MYQISSRTGVRHIVNENEPSNEDALKMFKGVKLAPAKCGQRLQVVNFYDMNEHSPARYTCSKCFNSKS